MTNDKITGETPMDAPLLPDRLHEMGIAFQKSRIFLTAFELDLFTALSGKSQSSVEVAGKLGTDPRATDRLMNALCALELLEKEGERFANTSLADQFLVRHSPLFLAGFGHMVNLWDTWSTLTEAVYQGHAVMGRNEVNDRGDEWLTPFIAAMHARAKNHAPLVVEKLDLEKVSRVLDVGGGSGAFAMAFANAKPGINATVFDLPNVVPLTRGYIEAEGLSARVNTLVGDYNLDPLGKGYDLVFLSAIIHSNSPAQNVQLLKKCVEGLNPGGQVVVLDFIMEENRTAPAHGAVFALNMLVGTEAGDTFTEAEVREWMTKTGLSGIKRIDTPFGTSMIIGSLGD